MNGLIEEQPFLKEKEQKRKEVLMKRMIKMLLNSNPWKNKLTTIILSLFSILVIASIIFPTGCARKEKKIKIGASLPLTGEVASYGQRAKRGIEIAVEEINATGGIRGKKIKVIFEDDRDDPKTGVSIMTKFATVNRVPVAIGSAGSTVSLAMVPVANQKRVVLLSPISSSAKLTTEGGPYFFRVCPADDAQAKILVEWVLEEGYTKVALIYTNNSWGKPLAETFKRYFELHGGKVVINEGVEEKTTDLRAILSKVKASNIKVVVSPTYPTEGANLVRQAKEMGLKLVFFGGDNWDAPEFLSAAGDAAEGVFFVDPSEPSGPIFARFADKYRKKYGEEPDVNAAFGYDALYAIAKAMEKAKALDGPSIRDALYKVSFEGATGRIEFDKNGDLKYPSFDRNMIKNGKKVKLKKGGQ